MISDDDIKREFLAAGFTVKPGHDDLKPYVYEAARRVLALAAGHLEAEVARAVAAERERWTAAAELAVQELSHCAPWTAKHSRRCAKCCGPN